MKILKMTLAAGVLGVLPSISVMATPLDITFTGGPVDHNWNNPVALDVPAGFQYEDLINYASPVPSSEINLAGVNSIQVTWNAPAGYMYVVNPTTPSVGDLTLVFATDYGYVGQSSSLGSVTASSVSVNTVYGTSPLGGGVGLNNSPGQVGELNPSLLISAGATISPTTASFAFTSITVTGDFSDTGSSQVAGKNEFYGYAGYFGVLYGGAITSSPIAGATDPGQFLTLEPLPGNSGSVPDGASTIGLAGLSFIGFLLSRKQLQFEG